TIERQPAAPAFRFALCNAADPRAFCKRPDRKVRTPGRDLSHRTEPSACVMTETTGLTGMGRAQIAGNLVLFPKFSVNGFGSCAAFSSGKGNDPRWSSNRAI